MNETRHWYKDDMRAYCGANLIKNNYYTGYINIFECDCIKCLEKYIKIKDKRPHVLDRKKLAKTTLNKLTYHEDFDKLIDEEKK